MYFIGIDGGGTKTKVIITDELLNVLGIGTSGASSIDTVSSDISKENIIKAFLDASKDLVFENPDIKSVYAGIGGISSDNDILNFNTLLSTIDVFKGAIINSSNDVINAHAGALNGEAGIAVIIGTGSVAFGLDEDNKSHRSGGYSPYEGDPGSASYLGEKALKLISKSLDGRIIKTPFINELLHITSVSDIVSAVKMYETFLPNRTKRGSIAKSVTKWADLGDEYALELCEDGTNEITSMIQATINNLNLINKEVGIIGSLGNSDTVYNKMLYKKLHKIGIKNIHESKKDPAIGSCILAKKLWVMNN